MASRVSAMTRLAASSTGCEARTAFLPGSKGSEKLTMPSALGQRSVAKLPPRLNANSRIALLAPAGPLLDRDDLQRAGELCRALGHEPVLGAHAGSRYGYLAGSDEDRLADLNAALRDDRVDAVWSIRGGYGVTRILHR